MQPFYKFTTNKAGLQEAIRNKKKNPINRQLLVSQLRAQYADATPSDPVQKNIELLLNENTFTICTAHQPNIFTGHLYFIYKIVHAIKMADVASKELKDYHLVPVFFLGSEDADLEELNHVVIDQTKYTWETKQQGAVGRMTIDKKFIELINTIEGRLLAEPFGIEITTLLKNCYRLGDTVAVATFRFVHELFKDFGLIVLLPDNTAFKSIMHEIFLDDLLQHTPSSIVKNTSESLSKYYPAQAFPRDINLFYMKDDIRKRIVMMGDRFIVHDTNIQFNQPEIVEELDKHPERFSPNVILRGIFQEMLLPDVVFIGGGGELAYWLQLKDLFEKYDVPYPVISLRNSFLIVPKKWNSLMKNLKMEYQDLFKPKHSVLADMIIHTSSNTLELSSEKKSWETMSESLISRASSVDPTLIDYVKSIDAKLLKKLEALEKKMLRAEKKKHEAMARQVDKIFLALNGEGLQERTDNFLLFYAWWGKDFLNEIYEASLVWDTKFCILKEDSA